MNAHVPAVLRPIRDIVAEYDEKAAAIPAMIEAFAESIKGLERGSTIGGTFAHRVVDARPPYESHLRKNLLQSAWKHVYEGLNLDTIASASDRKRFELSFEDPPAFTLENIAATFGAYVQDPRFHILKGLAEAFCDLDPAFKSHQKVKIGVEGLPKRIILRSVAGTYGGGGWGFDRLRDVINAIRVADGEPHAGHRVLYDAVKEAQQHGEADVYDGLRLQVYKNGNGHLIFDKHRLRSVNLALAEFYGDVLPDTPDSERDPERDLFKSRAVSKDLAYYPTPESLADKVIEDLDPRDGESILEPSCGDGRLLDAIRRFAAKKRRSLKATGVEVQPELAQKARAKGFAVFTRNFLEVAPTGDFDLVVMNPPFAGQHWKKHLMHARKFLKPGGRGICILPASAAVDGHLEELGIVREKNWAGRYDRWTDHPIASFRESGTNVSTGHVTFFPESR